MSKLIKLHNQRKAAATGKKTAPVSSGKTAGDRGRYVTLEQTPKNTLIVIPNPQAIAEFVADHIHHLPTDVLNKLHSPAADAELAENARRYNVWGDDEVLKKLIDEHLGKGWHWVLPESIGALTSAPVLEAPDGNVYWHERYQVEAAAEELVMGKNVIFDGAPENRQLSASEPKLPVSAAARKSAAPGESTPPLPPAATTPSASPLGAVANDNPFKDWQTETLIETIDTITSLDNFDQAKPEQQAMSEMAEALAARPVQAPVEGKKTATLRKAAAWLRKQASLAGGGGFQPTNQDTSKVLEGDTSVPDGRDKVEDNTGIPHPKFDTPSKFAANSSFSMEDQDTAKVLEGDKSVDQTPADEDHTGVTRPATETPTKVAGTGAFNAEDQDQAKVLEGDKSVMADAPAEEDHTGITVPATETPTKVASVLTVGKAVKLVEDLIEELQSIYIDSKPITKVNDTRLVREGVEAIYHATKALGEAKKVLVKQQHNEEQEAAQVEARQVRKPVKSSSLLSGLKLAEKEEDVEEDEEAEKTASVRMRRAFRDKVAAASKTADADKIADAIIGFASALTRTRTASLEKAASPRKNRLDAKLTGLREKITRLAEQLGVTATFEAENSGGVALNLSAAGGAEPVPTL